MPFRPIHCPYCGLELQVPTDAKKIVCMYCAKPIDLEALFSPKTEEPNSGLQLQKALALLEPRLFHFQEEEKSFTAKQYAEAFDTYCNRLSPALSALAGLQPEDCRGFAQALTDGVVEDLSNNRNQTVNTKSSAFFTRRMMLVAYLLPALNDSKVPEAQTVLAEFLRLWNDRYPQETLAATTFEQINNGFRRRKFCYITTAVCTALGQGDDCKALQLLRGFRDNWMAQQPTGPILTLEYYALAPTIVDRIDQRADAGSIYHSLWETAIAPCVRDIQAKRYAACLDRYTQMMLDLERTYLS